MSRGGKRTGAGRPIRGAEALVYALTVRVSATEYAALEKIANAKGVTIAAIIRSLIQPEVVG